MLHKFDKRWISLILCSHWGGWAQWSPLGCHVLQFKYKKRWRSRCLGLTIDMVGEDTPGIPLSCGLLILGKQPACLRAADSMGRFREIHLSRRGKRGRRRLTPGPDSKTERATETSSPLAFDLRQQNQAASGWLSWLTLEFQGPSGAFLTTTSSCSHSADTGMSFVSLFNKPIRLGLPRGEGVTDQPPRITHGPQCFRPTFDICLWAPLTYPLATLDILCGTLWNCTLMQWSLQCSSSKVCTQEKTNISQLHVRVNWRLSRGYLLTKFPLP